MMKPLTNQQANPSDGSGTTNDRNPSTGDETDPYGSDPRLEGGFDDFLRGLLFDWPGRKHEVSKEGGVTNIDGVADEEVSGSFASAVQEHGEQGTLSENPRGCSKPAPEKYSEAYFEERIRSLRSKIQEAIPEPDELIDRAGGGVYRPLLRSLVVAGQALESSHSVQKALQGEQKKHPDDEGWKDASLVDPIQQTIKETQDAVDNLNEAATDVCCDMLKDGGLLEDDCDERRDGGGDRRRFGTATDGGILRAIEAELLECTFLVQATPKLLAEWCAVDPEPHGSLLEDFLRIDEGTDPSSSLMALFLKNGGPSRGNYVRAMEIYNRIVTDNGLEKEKDSLRYRLALAVSLELATPIKIFHQDDAFVDPFSRYAYYARFETSNDGDSVDECFGKLSAWELRKVVNSDATNEDLTWGRLFLRNYRPDQITIEDSKWRYNRSVRTDVGYRHPDHEFSNYPELLSAGGECGARAWFGRFVCKAWGVPTWGVHQPGHAAMTRWTDDSGWQVCLGAGWQFSWWDDDRCGAKGDRMGPDFFEEARARAAGSCYYSAVVLPECLAESMGETVEADFVPEKFWRSLALAQRKKLAGAVDGGPPASSGDASSLKPAAIDSIGAGDDGQRQPNLQTETTSPTGAIVIPAASFVQPEKPSKDVMVLDSHGGGTQLHLENDGRVEYRLPDNAAGTVWWLSLEVVNVHRDQKPLRIEILDDDDDCGDSDDGFELLPRGQLQELEVPYTCGYWKETGAVKVKPPRGGRLGLSRDVPCHGLSVRSILLRPVDESHEA